MKHLLKTALLAASVLVSAATPAKAAETKPYIGIRMLTPAIANKIVVAAIAECAKRGFKVSASVVGRDGILAAFLRDPLSGPHTVKTSQKKAYSANSLQASTSQVTNRPDLNFAPGILLIVGGVPINVGGNYYGGVAVAGAEPEIDEKCAQAGIDAVTEALEFAD